MWALNPAGSSAPNGESQLCAKKTAWSIGNWLAPGGGSARFGGDWFGFALEKPYGKVFPHRMSSTPEMSSREGLKDPLTEENTPGTGEQAQNAASPGKSPRALSHSTPNAGPCARDEAETFSKSLKNRKDCKKNVCCDEPG